MFCGNCGAKLEKDDLFCPNCGEKVEIIEAEEPVERIDVPVGAAASNCCEACGTLLEEGDLFCPVCGKPVNATPAPDSSPEPESSTPIHINSESSTPSVGSGAIDLTERHELVILSRDEAISGCQKTIEIEGRKLVIDIPPYYNVQESMYFQGYGYRDTSTGQYGALKVDFLIQ